MDSKLFWAALDACCWTMEEYVGTAIADRTPNTVNTTIISIKVNARSRRISDTRPGVLFANKKASPTNDG